jgi:hypothetical protein
LGTLDISREPKLTMSHELKVINISMKELGEFNIKTDLALCN